jgi:hypothetical protein
LALPFGLLSALPDLLLFALSFATIFLPEPADSCTHDLMRVPSSAISDDVAAAASGQAQTRPFY